MPRKYKAEQTSGYTILLVDDDAVYAQATSLLLEREGHQVLLAENGPAALTVLRQNHVDLLLLDYFMPGMTGEEVVTELRRFNPFVQVILQTGYASERPPREMLRQLDIQGYYDKSEGPDKLLLWTDVGLKSAYTIQLLQKSRQGLCYILNVTPDLHKVQPLSDLLQGILLQMAGLVGAVNSFLAILPEGGVLRPAPVESEGFVAMVEEDMRLVIRASTGPCAGQQKIEDCLDAERLQLVQETLQRGETKIKNSATSVPLRVGNLTMGVIYLDRPPVHDQDSELLSIFANQAAVAIQNSQLYEMAALDPLTGVYARRFFEQWTLRELRTTFRSQQTLSLLMIDMDKMKRINDTAGHLAGDQALATVGKVLHQATRTSDIVGRYGGEEFTVVLPQTPALGALRVAQRIQEFLQDKAVESLSGPLPLRVSIGLSELPPHTFTTADFQLPIPQNYFQDVAKALIQCADAALYEVKRAGGNQVLQGAATSWPPLPRANVSA
jgi:diguanylate cyclase (GGDEF)-like protein